MVVFAATVINVCRYGTMTDNRAWYWGVTVLATLLTIYWIADGRAESWVLAGAGGAAFNLYLALRPAKG